MRRTGEEADGEQMGGEAKRRSGELLRRVARALALGLFLYAPTPLRLSAFTPLRLSAQTGIAVGSPAPVVTIADLEGKPVALGDLIGRKPVYLQFWATWCEICEALLPQVQAAAAKYRGEVEFLGVNVTVNQSKDRVRRYITEHKPPFRVLWDDKGASIRAYDVPGTSYVVIVDRQGKVAYTGFGKDQDLVAALRKVVGR
jgi:thiol-disulfide isomerase/thioredoxin